MDAIEHRIEEGLCPELAQAMALIYCRHMVSAESRAMLRAMAEGRPELLAQFDSLDELHNRHPFEDPGGHALREELQMLYVHHLSRVGASHALRQLRRLGRVDECLIAMFDEIERDLGRTAA